jgi:hypothetical protein
VAQFTPDRSPAEIFVRRILWESTPRHVFPKIGADKDLKAEHEGRA